MGVVSWFLGQSLQDKIAMVGQFVAALGLLGVFLQLRQQGVQSRTAF